MSTVQTAHAGMLNRFSRVRLFVTPRTVARQAPLSMGFSSQECWSGVPFPSPGDLPDPGIKPGSTEPQADSLSSEPPEKNMTAGTLTYIDLCWQSDIFTFQYTV